MDEAYYSTTTPITSKTSTSDDDFNDSNNSASPRTLYAQTFTRPNSSRSLPPASHPAPKPSYRKDMSTFTGFQTTEEEFDALPLVMQRKYFSTLERLRFAESSRSNALKDLPIQRTRKSTTLADRRGLNVTPIIDPPRARLSPRRLRKASRTQSIRSVSSNEASWYLTLPEKIKKKQFTREEQVILAGRLRESVILDAADEAIYKKSRIANRNIPNLSPVTDYSASLDWSSDILEEDMSLGKDTMAQSIYETFRWMDEEQDLDSKLVLDDYHANLDGAVIPTRDSNTRPSFRRTMSITKIPFGRNSLSSLGPRSPKFESHHGRQKSKALSMMVPKHTIHSSVSSIDPNATHYQDPEARLKLRVYLASPQKFDEAIEFGFPSMDGVTDDKENRPPRISSDKVGKSHSTETGHSFFLNEIDSISLFEDDVSMVDPDSPVTPIDRDTTYRSQHVSSSSHARVSKASTDLSHLGINRPGIVKPHEAYTHAMAGSREMTLRMTLTRPDLRADENSIYGWQNPSKPLQEPLAVQEMDERNMRGPFGGLDGWGPEEEKENGVVKRFWKKVKSGGSQRKSSLIPLR